MHYSEINSGGYRSLDENQRVSYTVTQGPKGPQATQVTIVRVPTSCRLWAVISSRWPPTGASAPIRPRHQYFSRLALVTASYQLLVA